MAKKTHTAAPWQDLEEQAYHAYREWPLWLALRERELATRVGKHRGEKPKVPQGEQK